MASEGPARGWGPSPPPCEKCQTPMAFVTKILDTQAQPHRHSRLFECVECLKSLIIPECQDGSQ
jgi:hypothetical protein